VLREHKYGVKVTLSLNYVPKVFHKYNLKVYGGITTSLDIIYRAVRGLVISSLEFIIFWLTVGFGCAVVGLQGDR
jgi:hypothetical protein